MLYIWFILIGFIAGWVSGVLVRGNDYGVLGDIFFGIIGALLGGSLFRILDVYTGGDLLGAIFVATIGAITFIFARRFIQCRPKIE